MKLLRQSDDDEQRSVKYHSIIYMAGVTTKKSHNVDATTSAVLFITKYAFVHLLE